MPPNHRIPSARLTALRWETPFFGLLTAWQVFAASWYLFHWGSATVSVWMIAVALWPAPVFAMVMAWRVARHAHLADHLRRTFRQVAYACLLVVLSLVIWGTEYLLYGPQVFPSLADLIYLGFFVVMAAIHWTLPRVSDGQSHLLQFALDVGIALVPLGTLTWNYFVQPALGPKGSWDLAVLLMAAYPMANTLLFVSVASTWVRRGHPVSHPLVVLKIGMVTMIVGNLIWMRMVQTNAYKPGGWPGLLWLTAGYICAFSMYSQYRWSERAYSPPASALKPLSLRSLALVVAGMGLLLICELFRVGVDHPLLQYGTALGTTLTIVRMAVTLRQNDQLQAKWRRLLDSSPTVIYTAQVTYPYQLTFISDNVSRVFGFSAADFQKNPTLANELIHPEDIERTPFVVEQVLRQGHFIREYRLRHKDGSYRWVRDELRLLQGANGAPVEIIGSAVDVTTTQEMAEALMRANAELEERVSRRTAQLQAVNDQLQSELLERLRAQEALRHSELHYRTLAETATDAILTVNSNGTIILVNSAATTMFSGSASDLVGRSISTLIPDFSNWWPQGVGGEGGHPIEATGVTCGGLPMPIELTYGQLVTDDGLLVTCVVRNISERKLAEAAVRAATREREESRDRFVQIAAHELRNPMTGVMAMLSLLRLKIERGLPLTEVDMMAARMEHEIDRLSTLLNEILDAFRTQDGRLSLHKSRINLVDVVDASLKPFMVATIAVYRFVFEDGADEPIWLMADARRLEDVLRNLLGNAVKYSPEGGEIRVRLAVSHDRRQVVVAVSDQGIGIPADQLSKVLEGFVRGRNLAGRDPGGLGLGLYISREVVRAHGGRIWADSVEGQGTTIYIELPLTTA